MSSGAQRQARIGSHRVCAALLALACVGAAAIARSAPIGYDVQGNGVRVGVWDEGAARASHVDLRGRVSVRDLGGFADHATFTTATIAGAGSRDASVRGMAPAARVWSYDWLLDLAETEAAAAAISVSSDAYGPELGWTVEAACADHPMWWGGSARADAAFGRYAARAAQVDALVRRSDLLLVWAAGNHRSDLGAPSGALHYHDGECAQLFRDAHLQDHTLQFGLIGGDAVAKNALTVGAARGVAPEALSAARIGPIDMSSFGPTGDGRIKPEILAGGDDVRSASAASDDSYYASSGTSVATAATAGAVALLTELYRNTHAGADPRAAELRALLVHSARDAGGAGPDYGSGYGLLDAQAAAGVIAGDGALEAGVRRLIVAALNASAGALELQSQRVAAGVALRVTLAWDDPPAAAQVGESVAESVLINDLDLELVAPDGTVFYPWSLDRTRPEAAATRSAANPIDNLEVVDVPARENHAAGVWTLRVRAAHDLWRDRVQPFAIVASEPFAVPDQPALAAPRYVDIAVSPDRAAEPLRVALGNRGAGSLTFRARSLDAWLAVTPQSGSVPAQLMLEVDASGWGTHEERLGRIAIDSEDPAGSRVLGVVARVACEPDCSGRACGPDPDCGEPCGQCAPGEQCQDGSCATPAAACPAVALGDALGLGLLNFRVGSAAGSQAGSCGGDSGSDLSASWRAPAAGRYALTTRGSRADTVLYARAPGCDDDELECNDDSDTRASAIALELTSQQQVTLIADTLDAADSDAVIVNIARLPCPSVDLGSRLGQGVVRASTRGGLDALHATCGGAGAEDVTLQWTAPAHGRYRFALFEPRFQAVLYVREGGCDGRELGCSSATDVGPVELELEQGQVVVIAIDGREGQAGAFELDIVDIAASCADACGAADADRACACDATCVAAGDCCADACERCGSCRCQRDCTRRACGSDGCGGSCGTCDAGETCANGTCAPDPCSGVTCDACSECVDGECVALAEGAACEDGDNCTVRDVCRDGACEGVALACDDGFACTDDRCAERSGTCVHTQRRPCCEPGTDCAGADTCAGDADACVAELADAGVVADAAVPDAGDRGRAHGGGCACRTTAHASAPAGAAPGACVWLALLLRRRRKRVTDA